MRGFRSRIGLRSAERGSRRQPLGRAEPNALWLGTDCFLIKAVGFPARVNQRPGVTVLVSRGAPLNLVMVGRGRLRADAVVFAPEVERRFAVPQPHFSLTLEPGHRLYRSYLQWAREGAAFEVLAANTPSLERVERTSSLNAWLEAGLRRAQRPVLAPDPRLAVLLGMVAAAEGEAPAPRAEEVWREFRARFSGSQSRWSRWLQAEAGLSLRKVLLGRKMRRAMNLVGSPHDATTIAHEVGFADSSHLSRLALRTFGVGPRLARNRKILQVWFMRDESR